MVEYNQVFEADTVKYMFYIPNIVAYLFSQLHV